LVFQVVFSPQAFPPNLCRRFSPPFHACYMPCSKIMDTKYSFLQNYTVDCFTFTYTIYNSQTLFYTSRCIWSFSGIFQCSCGSAGFWVFLEGVSMLVIDKAPDLPFITQSTAAIIISFLLIFSQLSITTIEFVICRTT
jgi:hypothetical protein